MSQTNFDLEKWSTLLPHSKSKRKICPLGIESPVQYFSFVLSFVTLTKCLVERISYLKYNQETKFFSTTFLIDLLEVVIMFGLCFPGLAFLTLIKNALIPTWMNLSLVGAFLFPITWFILIRFTRFSSNMLVYHIFALYWIPWFVLTYLFNFVSYIR